MQKNDPEIVSPLRDYVFTFLFGDRRNIEILAAFLKSVLDIPEPDYDSLIVVNPLLRRLFRWQKSGIVDVRVSDKSGRIIHIELQVSKSPKLRNRVLYYTTKLLWEQLKRGDDYDRIHQVISVVICDHVLLEEETDYVNGYSISNDRSQKHFTDLLKIITIELPKLSESVGADKIWPWARFLRCRTKEEFETLAAAYPEVEMAVAVLKKLSWSERWRLTREQESLWRTDLRLMKEGALEEGRAEGLAEGREEGKREIARRLKARGRPAAEIAEITGLAADEVERL
ncbi:MAG: Rpn family recombination-promoting nuclease/putative transposase [Treponema sp.]|jgi:predicted transposase/invertase (TIGR01784 family)|nr:Rpn family recombination-promoting nuclease/putative transposase [Treponema sp.]